jgi:hypothetical protein
MGPCRTVLRLWFNKGIQIMASEIKDGGPAFPCQPLDAQGNPCNAAHQGMTIRDVFAKEAMGFADREGGNGTAADAEKEMGLPKGTYCYKKHWPLLCARRAYQYADAMMIARDE